VGCLIEESGEALERYTTILRLATGVIVCNAHHSIHGPFAQAPQHVLLERFC